MTVVATAGGTFDRTERPIYFAAGSSPHYPRHLLLAVNDLFGKHGEDNLKRLLDLGHTILLDSGVFWLTNQHKRATGVSMDAALSLPPEEINGFQDLFDRYVYLTSTYGDRLWGYIELDQGGRDNKIRTRKKLHDLGLRPIPVYHPFNDGWDYFDEIAETSDRMCFGNVVQASQMARVRLLHTMWERRRQYPHLWIHVLGLSANEWCLPTPPDSCDSSTWLNALRYPDVKTEVAALRRIGCLGNTFRYAKTGEGEGDRDAACLVYADTMTVTNLVWADLQQKHHDLGAEAYPQRLPDEGELTWT